VEPSSRLPDENWKVCLLAGSLALFMPSLGNDGIPFSSVYAFLKRFA
jgi:hypothetical protein